ncbi:MAG TPA: glutathione synthetase [Actinomycetaceae bacterium]|nr:glutathione synthetase [Actinomycetaceae bacterium]
MKIGFVVNDVRTEEPYYTTTRLALAARRRDHEVWLMGMGDFVYEPDGTISAKGHRADPEKGYRSVERFLGDIQKPDNEEIISVSEFDVVLLRADPATDATEHPWANAAGVAFTHLLAASGVLVVNDPMGLSQALSKAYFQHFPEAVRPRTLISRNEKRIRDFVAELGGKAVMKPLQGSGGSGVFLVDTTESPNISQMIEALSRDGYIVTQEYLEEASDGDVRMFVMNGYPLQVDGTYAAFRRRSQGDDLRSNMSAGGKAEAVKVTAQMLELVEIVRPKLQTDGMFLVGLDIVGDKLMEANVFSPGGLGSCEALYGVDFAPAILADLEKKVAMKEHYGDALSNWRLATF